MTTIRAFLLPCCLTLAWAAASPAAAQVLGPDAAACGEAGVSAILVHVGGFRNSQGLVRVQAYGPNPADFLAKGKWVRRVELPLAGRTSLEVCLRLPGPGRYAVAVRHDSNDNGKSDWNDGGGFSRNPPLSLFNLKPGFDQAAVAVNRGAMRISVVMNYRHGLSIGPERGSGG